MTDTKIITIALDKELAFKLKELALVEETTQKALVNEAVEKLLKSREQN